MTPATTTPAPVITARGISHRYHGAEQDVLVDVALDVAPGTVTTLVGVNGCGKSTLLRVLCGVTTPRSGRISVAGLDPSSTSRRRFAQQVAVVHQSLPPIPGLSVHDFVAQGRFAARGTLGMLGSDVGSAVRAALDEVGMRGVAARRLDSLSGGERQRVRLAAALIQQGQILMLDEPTAHLDVGHQLELLELVRHVAAARGLTVVLVLHDLDHAARFSDQVIVLAGGRVHRAGPPAQVIDAVLLREVFGVLGRVIDDDPSGRMRVLIDAPISTARQQTIG